MGGHGREGGVAEGDGNGLSGEGEQKGYGREGVEGGEG